MNNCFFLPSAVSVFCVPFIIGSFFRRQSQKPPDRQGTPLDQLTQNRLQIGLADMHVQAYSLVPRGRSRNSEGVEDNISALLIIGLYCEYT